MPSKSSTALGGTDSNKRLPANPESGRCSWPAVAGRDGKVVELDPHTVPMPDGVTEEQMGPVFDYL